MEHVFATLNKKDSTVVLLEHYEASLHKADNVTESPRENERLLSKDDADEDEYSKILSKLHEKNSSIVNRQEKQIDNKIV